MAEYKPRAEDGASTPSSDSPPSDPPPAKPDMAAQHLRRDIDSGRTGDKIPASDPAAAPLGTDAEAAGMTGAEAPPPGSQDTGVRHPEGHQKGKELGGGKGLGVAATSMVAVVLVVLAVVMVAT